MKDVAEAGGWRDLATLQRSHIHSDPETVLSVVNASVVERLRRQGNRSIRIGETLSTPDHGVSLGATVSGHYTAPIDGKSASFAPGVRQVV
jgi:hypothetical protein